MMRFLILILVTSLGINCGLNNTSSPLNNRVKRNILAYRGHTDTSIVLQVGKFEVQLTSDSIIRSFNRVDSLNGHSEFKCVFYPGDGLQELVWKTDSTLLKMKVSETAKYFYEIEGASTYSIATFGTTVVDHEFNEAFGLRMELKDCQLRRLRFERNKRNDGAQFYYDEGGSLTSSVLRIQEEPVMLTSFDGIYLDKKTNTRYRQKWEGRIKVQRTFLEWSDEWKRYFLSW